jgi:hypothetical protein
MNAEPFLAAIKAADDSLRAAQDAKKAAERALKIYLLKKMEENNLDSGTIKRRIGGSASTLTNYFNNGQSLKPHILAKLIQAVHIPPTKDELKNRKFKPRKFKALK